MENITYSCGHQGRVIITGTKEERKRKYEWYENVALCPECYKKQKEAEREKQHQEALLKTAGLPELTGTEKQIKWAIDIRAKALEKWEKCKEANTPEEPAPEFVKFVENEIFAGKTEAKWWIENREIGNRFENFMMTKYEDKWPEMWL